MAQREPRRAISWFTVAVMAALAMLFVVVGQTARWDRDSLRGWTLDGVTSYARTAANQGVTVVTDNGDSDVVVRGAASIPDRISDAGWVHIGAPGSYDGALVDAYHGAPSARAIMFAVTSSDGQVTTYRHRLSPRETYHNSFAAISPNGHWLVSGGWGVETQLQVFADPVVTPSAHRNLPLAKVIQLGHLVRDVQGCTFAQAAVLYCSTNDPRTDLFPVSRQILRVALDEPLDTSSRLVRAHVDVVGSVPQDPQCFVPGETEGLSMRNGVLRLAVVPECADDSQVYTFRRA